MKKFPKPRTFSCVSHINPSLSRHGSSCFEAFMQVFFLQTWHDDWWGLNYTSFFSDQKCACLKGSDLSESPFANRTFASLCICVLVKEFCLGCRRLRCSRWLIICSFKCAFCSENRACSDCSKYLDVDSACGENNKNISNRSYRSTDEFLELVQALYCIECYYRTKQKALSDYLMIRWMSGAVLKLHFPTVDGVQGQKNPSML